MNITQMIEQCQSGGNLKSKHCRRRLLKKLYIKKVQGEEKIIKTISYHALSVLATHKNVNFVCIDHPMIIHIQLRSDWSDIYNIPPY